MSSLLDQLRAGLRRWQTPLRLLWLALILGYVGWRLTRVGWASIAANVPATPWFYVLAAVSFLALPGSERLIYRIIWGVRVGWAPFLRKRSLNNVVVGYSGDVYFYWWARTHLRLPDRRLLAGIKDCSVLSGIAGTLATMVLVAGFVVAGEGAVFGRAARGNEVVIAVIGIGAVLAIPIAWRFRRTIFWIDPARVGQVFAIHLARVILVLVLQVLQWWAAIPTAPLSLWLTYITLQQLVGQIPFAPNRDLLFLAVSLDLTAGTEVSAAALSGLLVTTSLLKQVANLVALSLTSFARVPEPGSAGT